MAARSKGPRATKGMGATRGSAGRGAEVTTPLSLETFRGLFALAAASTIAAGLVFFLKERKTHAPDAERTDEPGENATATELVASR
jgi:hypothetical protein